MCHHKHMARANASIVQLCLYVSFAFKNDDVNDVLFLCAVTFTTGLSVTVHRVEEERTTIEQPEPVHSGKCASHTGKQLSAPSSGQYRVQHDINSTRPAINIRQTRPASRQSVSRRRQRNESIHHASLMAKSNALVRLIRSRLEYITLYRAR